MPLFFILFSLSPLPLSCWGAPVSKGLTRDPNGLRGSLCQVTVSLITLLRTWETSVLHRADIFAHRAFDFFAEFRKMPEELGFEALVES